MLVCLQVAKAMYGDMFDNTAPRKTKEAHCSWCYEFTTHFFIKDKDHWLCDACKGKTAEAPRCADAMARLEGSNKRRYFGLIQSRCKRHTDITRPRLHTFSNCDSLLLLFLLLLLLLCVVRARARGVCATSVLCVQKRCPTGRRRWKRRRRLSASSGM